MTCSTNRWLSPSGTCLPAVRHLLVASEASYPGHVELLTNVARILAKLTLHGSAVDAIAMSDVRSSGSRRVQLWFVSRQLHDQLGDRVWGGA